MNRIEMHLKILGAQTHLTYKETFFESFQVHSNVPEFEVRVGLPGALLLEAIDTRPGYSRLHFKFPPMKDTFIRKIRDETTKCALTNKANRELFIMLHDFISVNEELKSSIKLVDQGSSVQMIVYMRCSYYDDQGTLFYSANLEPSLYLTDDQTEHAYVATACPYDKVENIEWKKLMQCENGIRQVCLSANDVRCMQILKVSFNLVKSFFS